MLSTRGFELRGARRSDEEEVWPLARDLATSYVAERGAFGRSFRRVLEDPRATVIVAVDGDDHMVGYVHVLVHPAFHANGNVGWVEEVMVAPELRGSGCGRQLMGAAEDWVRAAGEAAYLAVATRRAAQFYLSLGYEESATYFKGNLTRV